MRFEVEIQEHVSLAFHLLQSRTQDLKSTVRHFDEEVSYGETSQRNVE